MELPRILIEFIILTPAGKVQHQGSYSYTDVGERRACAERFNQCLLDGYTVTTRRVK